MILHLLRALLCVCDMDRPKMANCGRKNIAVNVVTCADFIIIWLLLKQNGMYKLNI